MPKSKKASVLVYSLIILSVMLMIAAAFSTTSIISRKNASVTSKSSQSFQVADSGANLMLKRLKDADPNDTLSTLGCTGTGMVTLGATQGLRSGSTAEVTFKDASDQKLDCSALVSEVDTVKSTGKFAETSRAVEIAVAQSSSCTEHDLLSSPTFSLASVPALLFVNAKVRPNNPMGDFTYRLDVERGATKIGELYFSSVGDGDGTGTQSKTMSSTIYVSGGSGDISYDYTKEGTSGWNAVLSSLKIIECSP